MTQDLANHLGRRVADQQIRCIVRLAGRVDLARLSRACRLAVEAEPILGCRLVVEADNPYWETRGDLDHIALCEAAQAEDPDAALSEFVATPIDASTDPLVLVRVFRPLDAGDIVCVKVNHVSSDVGGTKEYLGLLAAIYRRLTDEPEYRLEPNLAGSRGQDQVFRRFASEDLRAAARQMSGIRPTWGFPAKSRDFLEPTFAFRRIGPIELSAIKAYGKTHGATVNDTLLAALFRALIAVFDPPADAALTIQVPIDLRRYLPGKRAEAVCNLSSMLYPTIRREDAASYETALASVVKAMGTLKSGNPGLGAALYLEQAFAPGLREVLRGLQKALSSADRTKAHPMLSNFGVLEEQTLDFGDVDVVDATILGPILYPPGFLLGASTFRGALTLSVGYPANALDQGLVERVLDLVITELPAR